MVNWTTNVRKRNLKATVEKGKKPHHFLDFLFLADNRERKNSVQFKSARRGRPQKKKKNDKARNSALNPFNACTSLTWNNSDDSSLSVSTVSSGLQDLNLKTKPSFDTPKTGIVTASQTPINVDYLSTPGPRFHPGFIVPKVTPPRNLVRPTNRPSTTSQATIFPTSDLPPVNVFLDWSVMDSASVDDEVMLQEITKEGLVNTPQRRCSDDDITLSFDGSQLVDHISKIFIEQDDFDEVMHDENSIDIDGQSLCADDLEEIIGMDECCDSDVMRLLGEHIVSDVHFEV